MITDDRNDNGGGVKVVSFRLPLDLMEPLEALASEEGLNKSALVLRIVTDRLTGPKPGRETPLFPAPPPPHPERVEAVVRRELGAALVLLLAQYGLLAPDAIALVREGYLDGRLQLEVNQPRCARSTSTRSSWRTASASA